MKSRRQLDRMRARRGGVLVWFAVLLVILLGFVGLVIDGGLMMSAQRQAQNAADAAALAAATDRMYGQSVDYATQTASTFVTTHNGLANATVVTNIPPTSGPYAGTSTCVMVTVTIPIHTSFIQLLSGNANRDVRAVAVAGYEPHAAGEGVMVLNPDARPGLSVGGQAKLKVAGRVTINSNGGGVDETGANIENGSNGTAASSVAQGVSAVQIRSVGGVNNQNNFDPYYIGDPRPLKTRQLPEPDPLITLPTPMTSNGVDPTVRGTVSVTNNNANGLQYTGTTPSFSAGLTYRVPTNPPPGYNFTVANGLHTTVPGEVVLFPGVYDSISISGGTVYFVPGIYVLSPQKNTTTALQITGTGTVVKAEYLMLYNTSRSYSPTNGTPDSNDVNDRTPLPSTEYAGGFTINTGSGFTPINTTLVNYGSLYTGAKNVSSDFNGMLFYQRRRNQQTMSIAGNSSDGILKGTLYAKWAQFNISGQGTYDAQFIVGSIAVSGNGTVTILGTGTIRGKANQVYLLQ